MRKRLLYIITMYTLICVSSHTCDRIWETDLDHHETRPTKPRHAARTSIYLYSLCRERVKTNHISMQVFLLLCLLQSKSYWASLESYSAFSHNGLYIRHTSFQLNQARHKFSLVCLELKYKITSMNYLNPKHCW